jgi:hypothetical protein
MANASNADDRVTKRLRWMARIWSFPIIVAALLVLAGNVWNLVTGGGADPYAVEGYPLTEALPPILLFVSILGLGIAWRWERLGGVINLVFVVAVLSLLLFQRPLPDVSMRTVAPYLIALVVAVPGTLFLVCWQRSRTVSAV